MKFNPDVYELKNRLKLLKADNRPHFIIRDSDLIKRDNVSLIALTKSVLYSAHVIVLTEPCYLLHPIGSPPSTAKTTLMGNELRSTASRYIFRNHNNPLYTNTFSIIPEEYSEGYEEWEDNENWITPEYRKVFSFREEYNNKLAIRVNFNDPILAYQFTEDKNDREIFFPINVWLPELKNISLETMLKLRTDEYDSFIRFQLSVKRIIKDLATTSSTERLKEILQYVDYEVRKFESKLNQIKKDRNRSLAEALIGFSIVACCMLIPIEAAKMISAFIGSYHGKEFVRNLFRYKDKINDLKSSDFYAAWLAGNIT